MSTPTFTLAQREAFYMRRFLLPVEPERHPQHVIVQGGLAETVSSSLAYKCAVCRWHGDLPEGIRHAVERSHDA